MLCCQIPPLLAIQGSPRFKGAIGAVLCFWCYHWRFIVSSYYTCYEFCFSGVLCGCEFFSGWAGGGLVDGMGLKVMGYVLTYDLMNSF